MFKAITQFKATGEKGGYTLQWQGDNCPSYICGKNNTMCWYKYKSDAVKAASNFNGKLDDSNEYYDDIDSYDMTACDEKD